MHSKFYFFILSLFIFGCGHKAPPKYVGKPLPNIVDSFKRKPSIKAEKNELDEKEKKIEKTK